MSLRKIDHLVLAVRDLDAAGLFYESLGFKVSLRNRHPWGTENRIIQFPGTFLELISIGQNADFPPHQTGVFSFGAFIEDYLHKDEGFAMLALCSDDADNEHEQFARQNIGGFAPFNFKRQAHKPDHSIAEVAFSLAFARDRLAPHIGYFVCQHHFPENLWNPDAQSHPNQARALSEIALYAENPADHAEFMSAFTGLRDFSVTSSSIVFATHGEIHIHSKPSFQYFFGEQDLSDDTQLAAFTVMVSDLVQVKERFRKQSIPFVELHAALVVPAGSAFGVCLRFLQSL